MSLLQQINRKIIPLEALAQQCDNWKKAGERLVFTNGVFDLIHKGHITYLAQAAELGSKFIIGLNSDASVRTLNKGAARPIKDQDQRAFILAALSFVDAVVLFGDPTPYNLIHTITPNTLVKGGDYNPQETDPKSKSYIVGSDWVREHKGEVKVIPFLPGYSTTTLEEKIIRSNA